MAKEDWSEAKAWMRVTRERIGMTQYNVAVLANLTMDMVKRYEPEKYRIQLPERMREMPEHYLIEHRRVVATIMERHRGDKRAVLSFSCVSNLPEGPPDWVRAEESVKRRAAAMREAAVLLETEGVVADYTYMPEETEWKREGRPTMFGLYMLAIYLGIAIIAADFVAPLVVVALAVGLATHPIHMLALVFHKLTAFAAGLTLILALIAWFWYDHSKPNFAPCFWGLIGVIVASILICAFAERILGRPTRAERRAMKRATAQETGRVTVHMPVPEGVAAALESTRDGRRASL